MPIMRIGIRSVLDRCHDIRVIAEAEHGHHVIGRMMKNPPQIILMYPWLSGLDGLVVARYLRHHAPHIRLILFGPPDDDHLMVTAVRIGCAAYLPWTVSPPSLVEAIRAVGAGVVLLDHDVRASPVCMGIILDRLRSRWARDDRAGSPRSRLSPREQTIYDLLTSGLSNAAIADRLQLRLQTVKNYVSRIARKVPITPLRHRSVGIRRRSVQR
jgi:DNA-binding NarL/FixJ family response regulator